MGLPDALILDGRDLRNYVFAPTSGIFETLVDVGEAVTAGRAGRPALLARASEREPETIAAPLDGVVVGDPRDLVDRAGRQRLRHSASRSRPPTSCERIRERRPEHGISSRSSNVTEVAPLRHRHDTISPVPSAAGGGWLPTQGGRAPQPERWRRERARGRRHAHVRERPQAPQLPALLLRARRCRSPATGCSRSRPRGCCCELTDSPVAVGALALAMLLPTTVLGLFVGTADRPLRRAADDDRVRGAVGLIALAFAVLTLGGWITVWEIYALAVLGGVGRGARRPGAARARLPDGRPEGPAERGRAHVEPRHDRARPRPGDRRLRRRVRRPGRRVRDQRASTLPRRSSAACSRSTRRGCCARAATRRDRARRRCRLAALHRQLAPCARRVRRRVRALDVLVQLQRAAAARRRPARCTPARRCSA